MEARKICPNAVMALSVSSRQCTRRPHEHPAATPATNPACRVFSVWRVLPGIVWTGYAALSGNQQHRGEACVAGDLSVQTGSTLRDGNGDTLN